MEKSAKYVRSSIKFWLLALGWLVAIIAEAQPTAFTQLAVPKPMPVFRAITSIDWRSYYTPSFQIVRDTIFYTHVDAFTQLREYKYIDAQSKIANPSVLRLWLGVDSRKQYLVDRTVYAVRGESLRDTIYASDIFTGQLRVAKSVDPPYTSYLRNGQNQVRINAYFEDDLYRKYLIDTIYNAISIFDTAATRLVIERKSDGRKIMSSRFNGDVGAFTNQIFLTDSTVLYIGLDYGNITPNASGSTILRVRKNSDKIDTLFDAFEAKRVGGFGPRVDQLVPYKNRFYCVMREGIRGFQLNYYEAGSYRQIFDTAGFARNEVCNNAFVHNDSLFVCTNLAWYKKHISTGWERLPWPAYPGDWVGWAGGTVWSNGPSGIRYLENNVWKEPINQEQAQSYDIEQINGNQLTINTGGVRYYSSDAGDNWRRIPSNSIFSLQYQVPTVLPGVVLVNDQTRTWCNYDSLRTTSFVTPTGISSTGAEGRAMLVQGQLVALFNPNSVNNSIRMSRSTDLGRSWVNATVLPLGQGRVERTFSTNDVIFVQIGTQTLWRSDDLGQNWTQVSGFPLRTEPVVIASGHGNEMIINYHGVPYYSNDNGRTFTNWTTPNYNNNSFLRTEMNQHGIYSGDRYIYYKPNAQSGYIRLYTPLDDGMSYYITPYVSEDQLFLSNRYQLMRTRTTPNFHLTHLNQAGRDTVRVHPNPVPRANRQVRLSVNESVMLNAVELCSVTGQQVATLPVTDGLVTLPDGLNAGIYLLKAGSGVVRLVVE